MADMIRFSSSVKGARTGELDVFLVVMVHVVPLMSRTNQAVLRGGWFEEQATSGLISRKANLVMEGWVAIGKSTRALR